MKRSKWAQLEAMIVIRATILDFGFVIDLELLKSISHDAIHVPIFTLSL